MAASSVSNHGISVWHYGKKKNKRVRKKENGKAKAAAASLI